MIKKDFFYRFLIYVIAIAAILVPWLTEGKYNQDLLVMVVYLKTVYENTTLLSSFNDNVTFIYVVRKLFPSLDPYHLIFIVHNMSVVLLTYVLKKYIRPVYVVAFMLFSFFTIFCRKSYIP